MSYRTKPRPANLSSYWLRRWSTAVRVRDGFICCVCLEKIEPRYKAQAHHLLPKSLYPEHAFDLDNGVTVCAEHHQPVIHTTRTSWRRWVTFCNRWMGVSKRFFNFDNQHKIRR